MLRSRRSSGLLANPVLVGAVTVLITCIATFLAYNANRGLPFVPTRQVKVELPNGAALLPGNDVREGGFRIGIVSDMKPLVLSDGSVGAVATLKLDLAAGTLPADSMVTIRPRSPLGLKYVEVERGTSQQALREGDTLGVDQARLPVDLDRFFNMFDEPTRRGMRSNLRGFGDAFTQRGVSLNRTIEEAPRLLRHLEPVARVLAAPETDIRGFFKELGDFTRVIAPIAERYSHGFSAGADTFEAWSRDPEALKATIQKAAPTMRTGIRSFRVQRPFLRELTGFSVALEDAADELPRTLPRIIPALQAGTPVLRRTPEVNEELQKMLRSLGNLVREPGTGRTLRGLIETTDTLNPTLRFLGPYVTVCNYWNYTWTHISDHLTEPDPTGSSQRTLLNQAPRQANSPGSLGAPQPAQGQNVQSGTPAFLHINNYSAAIDHKGNADCESGQRGYIEKQHEFGKEKIVLDPHIPGNQGPTYTGRPRVPKGQTFQRYPSTTPMPQELQDP